MAPEVTEALVGRDPELAILHQLSAIDPGPSFVGLVGEAGIGKTRLLDEAERAAREAGVTVGRARGLGATGVPPLWPWVQVLDALGAPGVAAGYEPSLDTFRQRLEHVVARPTLIVLDDLQFLDSSSLAFLVELLEVQPIPLLRLLVASRPDEDAAVQEALSVVQHRGQLLRVSGLAVRDCAEILGDGVDAVAVHAATAGNPFHLAQVRRAGMPGADSLSEVLDRRWRRLPERVRSVLMAVALLGSECEIELIQAVVADDRELLSAALDEASRDGLLNRLGIGRVAFSHDLIREHACDQVEPDDLQAWHRSIARVLIGRVDAAPETSGAIAQHLALAGGDPANTLFWARRAGDHAMLVGAAAVAAEQFSLALVAAEAFDARAEDVLDIRLLHGEALLMAGDRSGATTAFRDAAELARSAQDVHRLAAGLVGLQRSGQSDELGDLAEELEALGEALLAAEDPAAARVLRALVELRLASGAEARYLITVADQAADLANRTRHLDGALHGAFAQRAALAGACSPGLMRDATAELRRSAEAVGNVSALHDAMCLEVADALIAGDSFGLRRSVAAITSLAEISSARRMRRMAGVYRASVALLEGRLDEVESTLEELGRRPDTSVTTALFGLHVDRLRAEFDPGHVEWLLDSAPTAPLFRSLVPWAYAAAGDLVEAGHGLDRCMAGGVLDDVGPLSSTSALPFLAEACWSVGATEHAHGLFARIEPFSGRCFVAGTGDEVIWAGPADLALGLLATLDPSLGDGEEFLSAAEATARRLDAQPTIDLIQRARSNTRAASHPTSGPSSSEVVLLRAGSTWTYRRGEIAAGLRHRKGLDQLVALLRSPGVEVHSIDLVRDPGGGSVTVVEGLSGERGSAGLEVFDPQARDAYRRRYRDLTAELTEAEGWNDTGRASLLREELDALAQELQRGIGLAGRARTTGSTAEKARVNVTRTLKAALDSIGEHDTLVADHLTRSIRTGVYCAYEPSETALAWRLDD